MVIFAPTLTVGWPSGQATVCKTVYGGSNPPPTSMCERLLDYQGVFFVFKADPKVFIADFGKNKEGHIRTQR